RRQASAGEKFPRTVTQIVRVANRFSPGKPRSTHWSELPLTAKSMFTELILDRHGRPEAAQVTVRRYVTGLWAITGREGGADNMRLVSITGELQEATSKYGCKHGWQRRVLRTEFRGTTPRNSGGPNL